MFEKMTDDEFRRHVAVVAHTMAYRRFLRDHPAARRADAWQFAVDHWHGFEDAAIDFLAVRVLYAENGQIARDRLN